MESKALAGLVIREEVEKKVAEEEKKEEQAPPSLIEQIADKKEVSVAISIFLGLILFLLEILLFNGKSNELNEL